MAAITGAAGNREETNPLLCIRASGSTRKNAGKRNHSTHEETRYASGNHRVRVARCRSVRRNGEELSPPAASRRRRWVAFCLVGHERFRDSKSLHPTTLRRPELGSVRRRRRRHGSGFDGNIRTGRSRRISGVVHKERIGVGVRLRDSRLRQPRHCAGPVRGDRCLWRAHGNGHGLQFASRNGLPVSRCCGQKPHSDLRSRTIPTPRSPAALFLEDPQRTNLGETTLSVSAKSNRVQLLNVAITIPETFLEGLAVPFRAISRSR